MTDFEWTPETLVALVFTVLWLLQADWDAVGSAVKKAGCVALVGLTLGLWHPCKPKEETAWTCSVGAVPDDFGCTLHAPPSPASTPGGENP